MFSVIDLKLNIFVEVANYKVFDISKLQNIIWHFSFKLSFGIIIELFLITSFLSKYCVKNVGRNYGENQKISQGTTQK